MTEQKKEEGMDAEQQFQEERRSGIGGSDAAAVVGVDPYRSPLDVYYEKVGLAPEREDNIDLRRGHRNEPWAIAEFEAASGFTVTTGLPVFRGAPETNFMMVHLDGLVVENGSGIGVYTRARDAYPLEVKCPKLHNFYAVKKGGATDAMVCQLQHGLAVDGPDTPKGWFVVFHGDVGHISFQMERDDKLIAQMVDRERMFWTEYVQKETPPPASFGMDAAEELELPEGLGAEIVRVDHEDYRELLGMLREARDIRTEAAAYYGEKDRESGDYSGLLGDLAAFMDRLGLKAAEGPGGKVYYRDHQGARYFDDKMLRAAAPLDALAVQDAILEEIPGEVIDGELTARDLVARLQGCRLDLSQFEKRRSPYRSLRIYYNDEA
jgi:putative phage-type endonuclease